MDSQLTNAAMAGGATLDNVLADGASIANYSHPDWQDDPQPGDYMHALVVSTSPSTAQIRIGRYGSLLTQPAIAWTHQTIKQIFKPGDVIYVKIVSLSPSGKLAVSLEEDSGVQGALIAIDNANGSIKAMVGGRDFNLSKFNRATQALRQVGSSFKPYVYTTAIDQGARPDDTILDAPTIFQTASGIYAPHNYEENFQGTITLKRALSQSLNIPALKLADKLGIKTVIDYAHRFGITSNLPEYLPVALGAAEVTVLEQTSAYSVFPDDGVRIVPRFITKVTDYDGRVLEEDFPDVKDVVSARTARLMTSMLRDVVLHGTAISASTMKCSLAGKTGTTNNFTDAWFVGFSPSITTGVWVGYDEKKSLGTGETGARAALPIWMDFMKVAMAGKDSETFAPPPELPPNPLAQKVDTPDTAPPVEDAH